jgi:hypothetical protein
MALSAGLGVGQVGRRGQDHWRITLDELRTIARYIKNEKILKKKRKIPSLDKKTLAFVNFAQESR